ncbi:DENN (AEX-3) domain-containing protein [Tanacetum coccineum]
MLNGTTENVELSRSSSVTERATDEHHFRKVDSLSVDQGDTDCVIPVRPEIETDSPKKECVAAESVADICDSHVDYNVSNKQSSHEHILNAILPLLRYQQYDSSDSSSSFQGSPSEDRSFRSDVDSADTEEAPFSGQEGNEQNDILDWAKTNNHGSLQIIYETILHMAGSTVDLMSCSTSFELAKAHRAFALEEAATALSVWAISCLCGSLRLDHASVSEYVQVYGKPTLWNRHLFAIHAPQKSQWIKNDDKMIQSKGGVDARSEDELGEDCRERGMLGLRSVEEMHQQLRDWLDLSLNHSVPSSLLILSRATLFSLPVDTVGVTSLSFGDSDIADETVEITHSTSSVQAMAMTALPKLSAQGISNIAWALSKIGGEFLYLLEMDRVVKKHSAPRLFTELSKRASDILYTFQPQELIELQWAFAYLYEAMTSEELFASLDRDSEVMKGLSKYKASESNVRRIQLKDIVKEVEDHLKTYSSAGMDIS